MARKAKNPQERIEELHQERVRIAGERHGLEAQLAAAQALIDGFPDLHRQALVDAARGRGDAVADVEREASQAQHTIAVVTPRVRALREAEVEAGSEMDAVRASDEGIAFFTARAEEASATAEVLTISAEEACSALRAAWMQAETEWGQVRRAYKRNGDDEGAPREVPRPHMPGPIATADSHKRPWPGGRRPEDEPRTAARTSRVGAPQEPLTEVAR